jgi:hypothetical protein
VNLRQYQTKHKGALEGNLVTKGNLKNKGWNIKAVRKSDVVQRGFIGLEKQNC